MSRGNRREVDRERAKKRNAGKEREAKVKAQGNLD